MSRVNLIDLTGEFPVWQDKLIYFAGLLENINSIPTGFKLGDPYPNPFNPLTIISYDIPIDSEIELSIYDLQGRLIEELIYGYVEKGSYEIHWNPVNISSGVYFIRMITPINTITRKLIFMK